MKGVAKKYSFTLFGVSLPDAFIRPHQGLKCLFRFGTRKSLAEGWMDEVWRIWSKFNHFQNVNKILENWHYLRTFKSRLLSCWPSSVNEFFIVSLLPFEPKTKQFWPFISRANHDIEVWRISIFIEALKKLCKELEWSIMGLLLRFICLVGS